MRQVDVLVVGAGAAGAVAALEAQRAGASTMLVDEFGVAGGYLAWSVAAQPGLSGAWAGLRGFEVAAALEAELARAGVEITRGIAWGLFEDNLLALAIDDAATQVHASSIVLATGSTDIVAPFPGWELPGVLTTRAALRCLHQWRVLPGERVAVLGAGEAAAEVVDAFEMAGAPIVASGSALTAGGAGKVEWVEIDGARVEADCVVIALGRQPDPELALQALCEIGYSPWDQAFVPLRDARLAATIAGVYVVGDAAGSCTTAEALSEGRLAGRAAAGTETDEAARELERVRSSARVADLANLRWPTLSGV